MAKANVNFTEFKLGCLVNLQKVSSRDTCIHIGIGLKKTLYAPEPILCLSGNAFPRLENLLTKGTKFGSELVNLPVWPPEVVKLPTWNNTCTDFANILSSKLTNEHIR